MGRCCSGFDGTLGFTSSARKNIGEPSGLASLELSSKGLDCADKGRVRDLCPGPSLRTLGVRCIRPILATYIPKAEPTSVPPASPSSQHSIIDTGRVLAGVPFRVPFGLGDAGEILSSLAFLEPDLGVIFEFKKDLTGVAASSFDITFGVFPLVLISLRGTGDASGAGDPETLCSGVPLPATPGVLDKPLGFMVGLPFPVVCLSRAIPKDSFCQGARVDANGDCPLLSS